VGVRRGKKMRGDYLNSLHTEVVRTQNMAVKTGRWGLGVGNWEGAIFTAYRNCCTVTQPSFKEF
jgi:hypothetical protein